MTPRDDLLERLAAIEARCAKATAGPWESDTTEGIGDCRFDAYAVTGDDGNVVCDTLNSEVELHEDADEDGVQRWDERGRKNLDFIAHARSDIPFLIEQLRLLRMRVGELEGALRPFAKVAKSYDDFMPEALPNRGGELIFPILDSEGAHMLTGIDEDDFRRARTALEGEK